MRDPNAWRRFDALVARANRWGGYLRATPVPAAPEQVVVGRPGWTERTFTSLDDAEQFIRCIEGRAPAWVKPAARRSA